MRTRRLLVLASLVSGAIAIVACAADPPPTKEKPAPEKEEKNKKGDDDDDTKGGQQQEVVAAPKPTPPVDAGARIPDAAVSKPPPTVTKPPAPTTRFCSDLSRCCGNLTNLFEVLACSGVAVAANETACGVELALCQSGGVSDDIGGLFESNNPECSSLAKCCSKLQTDGYTGSAQDCKEWVELQDENLCFDQRTSFCF